MPHDSEYGEPAHISERVMVHLQVRYRQVLVAQAPGYNLTPVAWIVKLCWLQSDC